MDVAVYSFDHYAGLKRTDGKDGEDLQRSIVVIMASPEAIQCIRPVRSTAVDGK